MSKEDLIQAMAKLLADTYALYLKTQNYHWHVKGPHFKMLHQLFEDQYKGLADAVDDLAERILTLGGQAPATFSEFNELKTIQDGHSNAPAREMLIELQNDHGVLVNELSQILKTAQSLDDEGTVAVLSERIAIHEKIQWMLRATSESK